MAQGAWTGSNSSAAVIAADQDRVSLTVQMVTAGSAATSLGFGTAAVAGEGVTLQNIGDSVTVRGHLAKLACNCITASGTSGGGYQTS